MEEDVEIRDYEATLRQALAAGRLHLPVTDAVEAFIARQAEAVDAGPEFLARCLETALAASTRRAVAEARTKYPAPVLRLGEYLRLLRESARIPVHDVAKAVGLEAAELRNLEERRTDPVAIAASAMARVLRFFQISLAQLAGLLALEKALGGGRSAALAPAALGRFSTDAASQPGRSLDNGGMSEAVPLEQLPEAEQEQIRSYIERVRAALEEP